MTPKELKEKMVGRLREMLDPGQYCGGEDGRGSKRRRSGRSNRGLGGEALKAYLRILADERLVEYIWDVAENCEGEKDVHNVDEVAACCRFLRMCQVYRFDTGHVRRYIRMAESLALDSLAGKRCYRLTPSQVFVICGMHGFIDEKEVELYGKKQTEDRKVVQESILFIPRKWSKTQIDAWEAVDDFLFGENDAEVHIVSNALDQSQIAFRQIRSLLEQVDPKGREIRMTAKEISWRKGRKAYIYCHTAGGKTKDGAKASKVIADEYGSAAYVKDHCDMSDALKVYESSMGPRKNRMSVITTTAGKVVEGPFELKLREAQRVLYGELECAWNEKRESDMQFLFALHPDEWEYTDECFGQERIWRKVNPHLGITIQSTFYDEEWKKTRGDAEHYKETVTKLFNKFVSASSRPWIQAEKMRKLQGDVTVRGLDAREWVCFCACDFSKGDDLCSMAYLCYNMKTEQYLMDCMAWIAEEQLRNNPNAVLYQEWVKQGWLRVCPGSVIDETMVLEELDEVTNHVRILSIAYDPYDSTRFVNLFQAWIVNRMRGKVSGKKLEEFLKKTLVPVSQTWASFNASCQVMYDIVNWPEQKVWVSPNPIIPWCFGNCVLEEDRMGNVKPVKRTANAKVDVAICLLMGVIVMERWK
ncbi:MAG: hypothetical protein J6B83_03340 [Bacteroidaceae bacterium]|nr:hypothetical protein [Bacteroidaceae bacterium]